MSDDEYQQVLEYISENSSDEENTDDPIKRKKTKHTWSYHRTFDSIEQANSWIKDENTWCLRNNYELENGRRHFYRCNKVPQRGPQCECALYLHFPADNETVIAYISEEMHSHDEILERRNVRGLNKATKEFIKELISKGVTVPKILLTSIANEAEKNKEVKLPKDLRQIYNFLTNQKKKTGKHF
jgi:hypothetical protein